jgi:hypothetical protein
MYDTFGTQDIPTVDATAEKVRDAARRALLPRYEPSNTESFTCRSDHQPS